MTRIDSEINTVLKLVNTRKRAQTLFLEPWGNQYIIPHAAEVILTAHGPNGGTLTIEVAEEHITVYGWVGSAIDLVSEDHPNI